MSQKPKRIDEIWSEKDLCGRLDLSITTSGRSRQLFIWVRGGLRYVEKSGRRYFIEQDVIEYLWKRHKNRSKVSSQYGLRGFSRVS
jgi:hypothetical protein